jgi:MFS family permease
VKGLGRYEAVLAPPGARDALIASLVGRMSLSMNGLAVLLLIKRATDSYAQAGLVAAAVGVSFAVVAPMRARAADRLGATSVLQLSGLLHPAALVALVLVAHRGVPLAVLLLVGVLIGASVPPLGSVMRALWSDVVPPQALPAAYALESVAVELCFITGPLLVAGIASVSGPGEALLVSAAFAGVGALWLARLPLVRERRGHARRSAHWLGPLVSPMVRLNLMTMLLVGVGFGAGEVAVIAFVEEQGRSRAVAGLVLAVWSFGSMLGGLLYGARQPQGPPTRQLMLITSLLGLMAVLPGLAWSITALAVAMAAYGFAIAPFFACNSLVLGEAAPEGTVTEAFAWTSSMIFGGAAMGTAFAGLLIDAYDAHTALRLCGASALLAAAVTVQGLRRLAPVSP